MDGPFVGRRRELAEVATLLAGVRAGHGAMAVITGEAGLGKSTLLAEVLRAAGADGLPVLVGRASSDEGAPAFWPWTRLVTGPAGAALGLDPTLLEPSDRGAAADPGELSAGARFRTIVGFTDALLRAARPSGLVVALEDAHWADPASLALLRHLCGEIAAEPVLVLTTTRTPLPDQVADVCALPDVRRLDLAALAPMEVAAFLGAAAHPSWPAVLHRHSGGNPLFLRELARLLDATTLRAPATDTPPAPQELRRVVTRRLDALSPTCRDLLGWASACGDEVPLRLVPAGAGAVAEAVAAGVLAEDPMDPGTLGWSHPVVRAAWYDALPRDDRVRRHAHLADALDAGGALPGEVARHRLRSAVDDTGRAAAAQACNRAAADATTRLAFDEAGAWHAQALPLLTDPAERAVNRLDQARAAFRDGQIMAALEHAEAALGAAEQLGRPDLAASAATVVTGIQGPPSAVVAGLCTRARALLGDEVSPRQAHVLAQHALALADAYDAVPAQALSRRAWELAQASDDPDALLAAARARQMLSGRPDEVHEQLALAGRVREVATLAGRPDLALWAHLWRIDAAHVLGAVAEVDAEIFALTQLVDRVGWPLARWQLLRTRASRAYLVGRFAEAEELALQFREVALRTQDRSAHGLFQAFIVQVLVDTGRFDDYPADPELLAMADPLPTFQAAWGWFRAEVGDLDAARHHLGRVRPVLPGMPTDARWQPTVYYAARLAAQLGDDETAAWCYARLAPYADYYSNHGAGCGGAVNTTLGILAIALGRLDDAVAHLIDAVAMERRIGALPMLARAQLLQARARAARGGPGDRDVATGLLDVCVDTARRLGMAPVAAQAAELASELEGLTAGPAALTAREREIAGLVAGGRSNREIAEGLVISERTVETHVRNLLAKLGLANRTQVASWAVRNGL